MKRKATGAWCLLKKNEWILVFSFYSDGFAHCYEEGKKRTLTKARSWKIMTNSYVVYCASIYSGIDILYRRRNISRIAEVYFLSYFRLVCREGKYFNLRLVLSCNFLLFTSQTFARYIACSRYWHVCRSWLEDICRRSWWIIFEKMFSVYLSVSEFDVSWFDTNLDLWHGSV